MSKTKRKIWIAVLVVTILFLGLGIQVVKGAPQDHQVNIYLFWGEGCPHCADAKPAMTAIAESNPEVGYFGFEVYKDQGNLDLFYRFAEAFGFVPQGVPTIFVGERYWVGYSETIRVEIQAYVDQCLVDGCPDPGGEILSGSAPNITNTPESPSTPTHSLTPEPTQTSQAEASLTPTPVLPEDDPEPDGENSNTVTLPLIGTVDLSQQSLLISTLIISFVDGFNPCSLWVLSMLLAITLNTQSRKKVLIIGLVFIFVTGLIYALFIGGLFTVFRVVRFIGWIQVIVALIALVFALVNIKDYFWFKEGLSFTISDEKKPGIYKGIRRILNANESIWVMIGSTVILAAGVSLVEFSCTAGLPMLWSSLVASQDVSGIAFIGYLLVYMLVYQLDELAIFLVSVFTLRKSKLEEKHGRILKLLGGMLMLTLAIVMLIDPTIMNNVVNTLWIFGAALGSAALVLLVHRVILPRFNIRFGTETKPE